MSVYKLKSRCFLETQNAAAVSVVKGTENQLKNPSVFIISESGSGIVLGERYLQVKWFSGCCY